MLDRLRNPDSAPRSPGSARRRETPKRAASAPRCLVSHAGACAGHVALRAVRQQLWETADAVSRL
eukprot:482200-Pyramimonas_sp.AAC.1